MLWPIILEDGDRTMDISFFQREPIEAPVANAPPKAPPCSYRMGPVLPSVPVH